LGILLMVAFSLSRWPGLMPDNFSAAYALAFCAGVYFPGRLAWWLPLGALLVSDVFINVFYYHVDAIAFFMLANYAVYGALIWLGRKFSRRSSWFFLLSGGLLGAVLFYLVSNTMAWLQMPNYPKSLLGWVQALTIGLPGYPPTWEFFRNTLLSGGLFTGLFVGAMKLSDAREAEETEPEEEAGETAPEESKA
jgi:hypothetical protein